jgi:hypothetical protein
MENWKKITGSYQYAVSDKGRVKRLQRRVWSPINQSYSLYKERILTPNSNNSKGYSRISIKYDNDETIVESVHRLVAKEFIPNPENKTQVNHKDGNKLNNQVNNLEWVTPSENMQHRINDLDIEHWSKGEDCNFAVLTEDQVKQIPKLLKHYTSLKISEMFGVSPTTITEITNGRSWTHLNLEFPSRKTSQYKGVFYRKERDKWGYSYRINGEIHQSCKFNSEQEAYNSMIKNKTNLGQDIVRTL